MLACQKGKGMNLQATTFSQASLVGLSHCPRAISKFRTSLLDHHQQQQQLIVARQKGGLSSAARRLQYYEGGSKGPASITESVASGGWVCERKGKGACLAHSQQSAVYACTCKAYAVQGLVNLKASAVIQAHLGNLNNSLRLLLLKEGKRVQGELDKAYSSCEPDEARVAAMVTQLLIDFALVQLELGFQVGKGVCVCVSSYSLVTPCEELSACFCMTSKRHMRLGHSLRRTKGSLLYDFEAPHAAWSPFVKNEVLSFA
eukprot:scaffold18390_cov15-Tisochrysis_lutea.AAC.1